MPCRDNWSDDHKHCREASDELHKRLNHVTQLLCYLSGELKYTDTFDLFDSRLVQWFNKHTKDDERRISASMDKVLTHHPFTAKALANKFIAEAEQVHPVSRWHKDWFVEMANAACERSDLAQKAKLTKKELVKNALGKLSPEEKKALGL